jgi:hypothetical protein
MRRDMRGYVADSGTSGEKCLGSRVAVRDEKDREGYAGIPVDSVHSEIRIFADVPVLTFADVVRAIRLRLIDPAGGRLLTWRQAGPLPARADRCEASPYRGCRADAAEADPGPTAKAADSCCVPAWSMGSQPPT